jgi:hypothetical protein
MWSEIHSRPGEIPRNLKFRREDVRSAVSSSIRTSLFNSIARRSRSRVDLQGIGSAEWMPDWEGGEVI